MGIESVHPEYEAQCLKWARARDCMSGEDAVKSRGETYIPRLNSQGDEEYQRYVQRASFFNSVGRTKEGFTGLIFRRSPQVKLPSEKSNLGEVFKRFQEDADLLGGSLLGIAKHLVGEVLVVGRAGLLVEWNDEEQRAFWVTYRAEDISNWGMKRIDGRYKLALLVLRECVPVSNAEDPFRNETVEQYRVLRLEPTEGGWGYVVDLWRKFKAAQEQEATWQIVESRAPVRNGRRAHEIPFVFFGPVDAKPTVCKGPLEDLITLTLDHFRLDADFKHGLHYTALPTAWVSGFDKDSTLQMGASTAWVTETIGATAGFLEFKGEGLKTFERAQDRDERLMALLGSRLLEAQKKVGESAEAMALRQANESSVVANIATSISVSITQALRWVYWWHSTEDGLDQIPETVISYALNTDFETAKMSAAELLALVQSWQAGAISLDTLLDRAREGEIIATERTNDEEKELIDQSPALLTLKQGGRTIEPKEGRIEKNEFKPPIS